VNASLLAEAATRNFVEHASWAVRRLPGARVELAPNLVVSDSGLAIDTVNIVCAARLREAEVADSVRRVRRLFGSRPFSWWVAPGDEPKDLGARLEAEGLSAADSELAMSTDVAPAKLPGAPGDLAVRRVTRAEELSSFAAISAANWDPPDQILADFYRRSTDALLEPGCPIRFYVAELSGEPVAGVEITLAAGVAGVYGLSTMARHRRRGIGAAVLSEALRDSLGHARGRAVLQAAEAGVGLYRRLGFVQFGKITEYKPHP